MQPTNATLLFLDSALDLRPNRFEELADIVLANKKCAAKPRTEKRNSVCANSL